MADGHDNKLGHQIPNDKKFTDYIRHVASSIHEPWCSPDAATWNPRRKAIVVAAGFLLVINSTLGSSLSSGCIPYFASYFNITSKAELVLPNSLYILGYVFGPPLFSPLSEIVGRRRVLQISFLVFTAFTLGSALAPTWGSLLLFRTLTGISASAPISVVGGLYADIFNDPIQRGRAIAVLIGGTTIAPVIGPIISAFVSPISWRWTFWIALIAAGAVWPLLVFLPETYAPVLRARQALARSSPDEACPQAASAYNGRTSKDIIASTLARPVRLLAEPIVLFGCVYLAFEYAMFYIFFVAYPIVFEGTYHMTSGIAALPLLPIGLGAAMACVISAFYDGILRKAMVRGDRWAETTEYRRLPLACLGGPLHVVALFWLGWTARPTIHWIVPTLAGLPFGIGVELCFISLLNYLTDAYSSFAASVLATSAFTRSLFAVLLPLCVDQLYRVLGVAWAFSLLGFVSLFLTTAPFLLLRYGSSLRKRSKFCERAVGEDVPVPMVEVEAK